MIGFADVAHIFVDGRFYATSLTPLIENRGSFEGSAFTQSVSLSLSAGEHELAILSCAMGLIKGDWMIDAKVEERKGLWGHVRWNSTAIAGPWSMQPGLVGELTSFFAAGGALVNWQSASAEASGKPLRWWRLAFTRPQEAGPYAVDLGSMQKGMAWLNGRYIGRYWLTPANCEHEDQSAECELTIQAVASLIYGTNEPATFSLRDWGNPSTEVQATMQQMFPLLQPFLYEVF